MLGRIQAFLLQTPLYFSIILKQSGMSNIILLKRGRFTFIFLQEMEHESSPIKSGLVVPHWLKSSHVTSCLSSLMDATCHSTGSECVAHCIFYCCLQQKHQMILTTVGE